VLEGVRRDHDGAALPAAHTPLQSLIADLTDAA
jgi:hypothetical protein